MSGPMSRLQSLVNHLLPSSTTTASPATALSPPAPKHHIHTLSPTFFLPRAAAIEPDAPAIHHVTANGQTITRSYQEFADRSRGLAYYLKKQKLSRIGILCPNTPAFLESIFGVAAAGAIHVGVNYRLKEEDIIYIFEFAKVDCIIVDREFVGLLEGFRERNKSARIIVDEDTDKDEGEFDQVVLEGLKYDGENGGKGWDGLHAQADDEDATIAIPFTSGTTAKPKGVVYTHRGAYLASLGNVVESGLNFHKGRCGYLWTLPMFHAVGWTFPWAVTAVRGTHFCLRKIDYPLIWNLLKSQPVTHFNAAPTVNTLLCASKEATKLPNPVRVTVAASPPTAHLFETMTNLNLIPVHVYGMTETYGPITKGYHMPIWEDLPQKEKYARMARQGHGFLTSLNIRIIKPDQPAGKLIDVARDGQEIGEIIFVGNICAKEYYNDPEATAKLFAGGALHSGDLAVWHEDGSAQILDRAKDIIISGGENISSVALEAMLVQHEKVLEAGVVAVKDEKWGEVPVAFVTVRDGDGDAGAEGGKPKLKGEDVVKWAKEESSISRFMVPKEVVVVKELPKTSTGKVKKNVLREWAGGNWDAR
ncbi:0e1c6ad0-8b46-49ff-b219-d3e3282c200b [Sclerotinia trifoliorum]|uniref:0e1c6ad0-8b46-49ff-b219-d3e3282c200b n=1 Tax=Sclerotinia trifoliorum TaxID=28548 RepID=A0A8H2VR10_9HELO|nr:0e1c6ad0-8b46-49ff-b219-d3e3282c200b [Sclerotinia trifoliorum]